MNPSQQFVLIQQPVPLLLELLELQKLLSSKEEEREYLVFLFLLAFFVLKQKDRQLLSYCHSSEKQKPVACIRQLVAMQGSMHGCLHGCIFVQFYYRYIQSMHKVKDKKHI